MQIPNFMIEGYIKDGFNVAMKLLPEFANLLFNQGWNVEHRPDILKNFPNTIGRCDYSDKTIRIFQIKLCSNPDGSWNWDVWNCYCIHEACHALAGKTGHYDHWAKWMDKAKERAEKMHFQLSLFLERNKDDFLKFQKIVDAKGLGGLPEKEYMALVDSEAFQKFLRDNGE